MLLFYFNRPWRQSPMVRFEHRTQTYISKHSVTKPKAKPIHTHNRYNIYIFYAFVQNMLFHYRIMKMVPESVIILSSWGYIFLLFFSSSWIRKMRLLDRSCSNMLSNCLFGLPVMFAWLTREMCFLSLLEQVPHSGNHSSGFCRIV